MEFTGASAQGVTFRVTISAYNPNTFDLNLRDLNARLILDGNDVGSAVTVMGVSLPARNSIPVTTNVTIPWNGIPNTLMAAAMNPTVSYTLEGQVTVDHYLSIRASFATQGTVPRSIFLQGAMGSMGGMINSVLPGLGGMIR
jgi:LEA14-like dessication related protein